MLAESDGPDRLRALLEQMREFGLTRIVTPDGYCLERPAPSPFEAPASVARATGAGASKDDPDDLDDIEREERAEKRLESEWNEHWRRLTLSSGSAIPKYPGPEKAQRFLGGRS